MLGNLLELLWTFVAVAFVDGFKVIFHRKILSMQHWAEYTAFGPMTLYSILGKNFTEYPLKENFMPMTE